MHLASVSLHSPAQHHWRLSQLLSRLPPVLRCATVAWTQNLSLFVHTSPLNPQGISYQLPWLPSSL